ncbi:MAG: DUF2849 domain-containing protein [Sphingomonadales bacterium]|nr:DUF2849 domain-containing protein [Sphingomonadales bacterium]MDE2567558.1 DUF2849 domain-containing protein [Sphingomonadales bacterium]
MKIITGNNLRSGAVVWWTGYDWSLHVEDSIDVGEHAEAVIQREEGAQRVNGAHAVEATRDEDGVRPAHIKDRIRALGPTVRPDLTLKPADPAVGNWVI